LIELSKVLLLVEKNQGICKAGFAFGVTGVLEGHYKIAYGYL
jgi:hypothetical protein